MRRHLKRVKGVIHDYSLLLIIGAIGAMLWANTSPQNYKNVLDMVILDHFFIGHVHIVNGVVERVLTLQYLINDVFMSLFFAIAGKEIWEACALRGGAMQGKKAVVPFLATIGGMAGPVTVYLLIAHMYGESVYREVVNGWAIPTATDIAFSVLIARLIFGVKHPAVAFLLLLAIVDDAGGLLILAAFYPTTELQPQWLLLSLTSSIGAYYIPRWIGLVGSKKHHPLWMRIMPYGIAGALSWYGFQESGIHPALGLLPIIPAIPHADNDTGIFAEDSKYQKDLLNIIEHRLKTFVQVVLFFFGLVNAGVVLNVVGPATTVVFLGLMIGKPLGIFILGFIGARVLGLGLPEGMSYRELVVVGFIAAIGFTVALFVATVAFPSGATQDAAKMGAVLSFAAAGVAILVARLLGVKRMTSK